jgi:hypothetical protein
MCSTQTFVRSLEQEAEHREFSHCDFWNHHCSGQGNPIASHINRQILRRSNSDDWTIQIRLRLSLFLSVYVSSPVITVMLWFSENTRQTVSHAICQSINHTGRFRNHELLACILTLGAASLRELVDPEARANRSLFVDVPRELRVSMADVCEVWAGVDEPLVAVVGGRADGVVCTPASIVSEQFQHALRTLPNVAQPASW